MITDKEANEIAIELGKRKGQIILEYESLPKIHGWVARDGDDKKRLCLFTEPPVRIEDMWLPEEDRIYLFLDNSLFPEITWESEPVEVELLIRKI